MLLFNRDLIACMLCFPLFVNLLAKRDFISLSVMFQIKLFQHKVDALPMAYGHPYKSPASMKMPERL